MSTRVHKVGAMTLGITLVAVGLAYLAHLFFPMLSYIMIIRAWPLVFVLLGIEILLSNLKSREEVRFALVYPPMKRKSCHGRYNL